MPMPAGEWLRSVAEAPFADCGHCNAPPQKRRLAEATTKRAPGPVRVRGRRLGLVRSAIIPPFCKLRLRTEPRSKPKCPHCAVDSDPGRDPPGRHVRGQSEHRE